MSKNQEFIKISQVVGQAKVIASFEPWQVIIIVTIFLLILGLRSIIGLFNSAMLGGWILGTIAMITRGRPDNFIRRLWGRPKRWQRGFSSSNSLLLPSRNKIKK